LADIQLRTLRNKLAIPVGSLIRIDQVGADFESELNPSLKTANFIYIF